MPSSNKSTIPQSKEEISDLISESAETYSEDLSTQFKKERREVEKKARESSDDNLSQEMITQYSDVIEAIKPNTESSNSTQTSHKTKVTSS